MITKTDWHAVNQQMMADDRRRLGEPPTDEEMLAYTKGELSEEAAERVRQWLVSDPELVRALTEPFPDAAEPGGPDYVSDREFAEHWTVLQERMGRGKVVRPAALQFWRISTMAASIAAAFLGVLLWQTNTKLHEPRAVWEEQVLFPDARRGAASEPVPLTAQGESILLVVPLIERQKFSEYRLEIVDLTTNRSIWSSATLRSRDDDAFAILVPRRFLKRGDYRIVVHGVAGNNEERLSTFSLRVP